MISRLWILTPFIPISPSILFLFAVNFYPKQAIYSIRFFREITNIRNPIDWCLLRGQEIHTDVAANHKERR
jgi:hypothetical protein